MPYSTKKKKPKTTCTQMFVAALFVITKDWKQSRYPLPGEWLNSLGHIYTTGCYSAIKKDEHLIQVTTQMHLQWKMLSEKKPFPKDHIHMGAMTRL